AAEGGINGVSQFTRWRSSGIWTQNFPKERMVGVAAGVISYNGPDCCGNYAQIGEQFLNRFCSKLGIILKGIVIIGDVSLMMFVVMDFHRLGIDVRLQCGEWIR